MRVTHLTRHGTRTDRRFLSALAVAALLTATAGASSVAVGPAAASPSTSGPAATQQATDDEPVATTDAAPGGYRVTLLTGDVVVLHVAADGRQTATLEEAPRDGSGRDPQIFERDGQVHVVPAEVSAYLASGALDERLFNVTSLVEQGLHDAAVDELPLVVARPDGPSTFSAPQGARVERELPSIDAVSMAAEKSEARAVWTSLRGPAPLADEQPEQAELAAATTVWLNGRVEATLDESVSQVGVPQAWEAGYDGSDVRVAVLDSGYDPHHPDLRDQVIATANFSPDEDPAGETAVDGNGHGTHVAATIAGTGAASDGRYRGVAPGADLLIGKVLDNEGGGFEDEIIAGMEWAVEEGAQVVNMSLGTRGASDGTDPLSEAVNRLTETSGALFVAAAGNAGPGDRTVGAPGAADQALTVGAVDKSDQPAWFSSRGPRIGDGAIKPEIVAPGVDIVAARAAGTSVGNLVDEYYTALNGTSMATPHVAGAAAILAQQHGEWDAGALKARLVSSSEPLDGEPISFQGAGRLDVPAAIAESVGVSSGALYLGRVQHDAEAVTATLTYTNPTDERVTLRLSGDVERSGPDDGAGKPVLRFSRPTLSIPAGGEASTTVLMSPRQAQAGDYEGYIAAEDVSDRALGIRTVTSFSIVPPSHTVTVNAVDRNGDPARGPVDLFSTDTWEGRRAFLSNGVATFDAPAGRYTVVADVETPAVTDAPASVTVAGEPELVVDDDVALSYDARDGEPLTVVTPRDVALDNYHVLWRRSVGGESVTSRLATGVAGEDLFALPSTDVGVGEFDLWSTWHLVEPLMTLDLPGEQGPRIDPLLATNPNPYVGEANLPMVYVGQATPEDFADVDAEGRIAVASRPANGDVRAQSAAAHEAGAEFLLVHNDRPGYWATSVWMGTFPTYTIEQDAGAELRAAMAEDPEALVDVTAIHDSTYTYHLAFAESGRIPAGRTYDVADQPVATVEADYREDSQTQGRRESWIPYLAGSVLGTSLSMSRNGPVERTDYVSAEGVEWQRFGQPHGEFLNMYWTSSAIESYEAGETYHQEWWGPLVRPSVPPSTGVEELGWPIARFHDAIRISLPHYRYGNWSLNGSIYEQLGDVSEMTLHRDGELVGTSTWPQAQYTVPAEDAGYELRLTVDNGAGNWRETSVATDTTWRFRSGRADAERTVLPLVQANYELAAGPRNEMPVGEAYPLVVDPEYQPGASGPGEFEVSVRVSFDDGASWTDAPVEPVEGGRWAAAVPASPQPGFAAVRVTVTDADGSSMTQRIDRAWRISSGG